jgi:hypothetical protein
MSASGGGFTRLGAAGAATGAAVAVDVAVVAVVTTGTAPVAMDGAWGGAVAEAVLAEETVGVAETWGFGAVTSWAIAANSGVMTDGVRWRCLRTGAAGAVDADCVDCLVVDGMGSPLGWGLVERAAWTAECVVFNGHLKRERVGTE